MKVITVRQFGMVKRVAQNVNPLVTKKNKLKAKIAQFMDEIKQIEMEIEGHEAGVKMVTGGYISEDLVTKKVTKVDKYDKDGNQLTKTEYIPTNILVFDEDKKVYNIIENTEDAEVASEIIEANNALPMPEMGNDFDADAEIIKGKSDIED